eukprot:COSAG03_NODE_25560_length_265_cov_0.271084_1_plen_51_part_10
MVHSAVCGPITSWDILPAGATIDRIPPPYAYVSVHFFKQKTAYEIRIRDWS